MSNQFFPIPTRTISRNELCWLLGAIVFGAILRLSFPGRMAIEHFDEGVYASNFWFGAEDGYSYPARYLYAPPLLPAAIEWTMTFASLCGIQPTGFIPMIPCLLAGIAMIPSIWWICRQWFGPTAGLTAAWLVSTSDFHVSYSRAALTDVPVCLFILWAVYFSGRAFLRITSDSGNRKARSKSSPAQPWRDILLAGGFTGLAWWTKYNGWLPLAIGLTGSGLWQLLTPRQERQLYRVVLCWLEIALIAFLVWSPVLWGLQKHGGYSTVAANHGQYVVGFKGWGHSVVKQLYNIGYYEDPLDLLHRPFNPPAVQPNGNHQGLFKLPYGHSAANSAANRWLYYQILQAGEWKFFIQRLQSDIFDSATPLFVPVISLVVSIAICLRQLVRVRQPSSLLFLCLVFSWFAGMTVATPFYHPYPRLVLPWLCASWICLGLAAEVWFARASRGGVRTPSDKMKPSGGGIAETIETGDHPWPFVPSRWTTAIFVSLPLISILRLSCGSGVAWSDRSGIEKASKQLAATVKREVRLAGFPENEGIVYVLGEPALVFGLKAEGLGLVGPVQGFGFIDNPIQRPTFLAFPPRTRPSESDSHRFQKEDGLSIPLSHLVLLDGDNIDLDRQNENSQTKLWRLYR